MRELAQTLCLNTMLKSLNLRENGLGEGRLTARHGGAREAEGTQGAPRKMRRQGAATPGATHRVSVGCAPSLRLPRQPSTTPLKRLPPHRSPWQRHIKVVS